MSRMITDDPGDPGGPGSPTADIVWVDINFSYTEPQPQGFLQGFEVVAYTGANPNDGNSYLFPPQLIPAADRRCVKSFALAIGTTLGTVNAAVRAIYPYGKSAWASSAASVSSAGTGTQVFAVDNLIPNPTSELGASAYGMSAVALVNDAGNAYAGNWVRRVDASNAGGTYLSVTPYIACVYGDQFSASAYIKSTTSSQTAVLVVQFYNAAFTFLGQSFTTRGASTYDLVKVQGAAPAGTMYVRVQIGHTGAGSSAGTYCYFDNLSLRRSVDTANMENNAGFRVVNAIGNTGTTTSDRVYYRGNNDPATLGGAPNIGTLTITPALWDTTNKQVRAELKMQPTAVSDNLDGMRYAKIVLYRQSAAGTTGTLTALGTYNVLLPDRLYNSATDSNAANALFATLATFDAGITSGVPAMLVTIYNAVGPSNTNCFYAGAGWTAGTALTNNGTAWPAGLTGGTGGGTGGGSGGGGPCPAPWTLIDLPGGEQKPAADLQAGDLLYTVHTSTNTSGCWPVKAVSIEQNERWDFWVEGRDEPYTFSKEHRVMTSQGWKEVYTLEAGDVLVGQLGVAVVVIGSAFRDVGDVVRITVEHAGAYCVDGIVHSNLKNN